MLALAVCLGAFLLLATPSFAHDDPTKGSAPDVMAQTNPKEAEAIAQVAFIPIGQFAAAEVSGVNPKVRSKLRKEEPS